MLMIADVVNHELCGSTTTEVTAASTTQLLDISTRTWSDELVAAARLRRDLLPPLHEPGAVLGTTAGGVPVVAVASHDTASAVAGTPLRPGSSDVYISCGTWALVGCELAGARYDRDRARRQRDQRAGRRGLGAPAQERDRAVAPRGEPAVVVGARSTASAAAARGRGGAGARRSQRRRSRRSPVRHARRPPGADRRGMRRVGSAGAGDAGGGHADHPRLARREVAHDRGDDRAGRPAQPPSASTSSAVVRRSACSDVCARARANAQCSPGPWRRR